MGEKRKPSHTILLKNGSKTNKLELYDSRLWTDEYRWKTTRYRIRHNGKWFDKKHKDNQRYFTKWEFRDILFKSWKI